MEKVMLKDLKKGDYFTKKPIEFPSDSQVFIKEDYERSEKKYFVSRFSDFCDSSLMSGSKFVYVGFTF